MLLGTSVTSADAKQHAKSVKGWSPLWVLTAGYWQERGSRRCCRCLQPGCTGRYSGCQHKTSLKLFFGGHNDRLLIKLLDLTTSLQISCFVQTTGHLSNNNMMRNSNKIWLLRGWNQQILDSFPFEPLDTHEQISPFSYGDAYTFISSFMSKCCGFFNFFFLLYFL